MQLVLEIIKQSGEKTNKFYFYKNSKDGTKIAEDSIQLLWNCLDAKHRLNSSSLKSLLEALEANVTKAKGGKTRMIEMCIEKLRTKSASIQHIKLLNSMLESLEAKATFMSGFTGSDYDKTVDKVYNQGGVGLASLAFEDLTENAQKESAEEKNSLSDEKTFIARIHLILLLVFKGKQKPDSAKVLARLMAFLISSHDAPRRIDLFNNYLTTKEFVTPDNSSTFFSVINDLETPSSLLAGLALFRLYESVFVQVNTKSGALDRSSNKKNLVIISKQEKFLQLKQLWIFCLKSRMTGSVRELYHKLLVECYFRGSRKYEAVEAQKAWTYFTNDVMDEMNAIRMNGDPRGKAILLGNMANIWITAIEISSGALYIGGTSPSPDTLKLYVVIYS